MVFSGMTPDQIDQAASQLRAQTQELTSLQTRINSLVNEANAHWSGADVQRFSTTWRSSYSRALVQAIDRLETMADSLTRQAADQRLTSQAENFGSPLGGTARPLSDSAGSGDETGDRDEKVNGPGEGLPQDKTTIPVNPDIMDTDPMDPAKNTQKAINDCWLIVTIDALMESEEGRDQLRNNIEWDEDEQGYWVTIYVDGKPTKILVTDVVSDGAVADGKQGIVSLYEAAIFQAYGWDDLDFNSVQFALNGVADERGHMHTVGSFGPFHRGISDDVIQSGGSADGGVTVVCTREQDDTVSASVVLDPNSPEKTVSIEIPPRHAMEVVDIRNGLIGIRNPWGHWDPAQGTAGERIDGVVYFDPDTVDDVFDYSWATEFTGIV